MWINERHTPRPIIKTVSYEKPILSCLHFTWTFEELFRPARAVDHIHVSVCLFVYICLYLCVMTLMMLMMRLKWVRSQFGSRYGVILLLVVLFLLLFLLAYFSVHGWAFVEVRS